ncbi:MAG: hypothetical protein AAF998_12380 [Bacteroidota bacterium]
MRTFPRFLLSLIAVLCVAEAARAQSERIKTDFSFSMRTALHLGGDRFLLAGGEVFMQKPIYKSYAKPRLVLWRSGAGVEWVKEPPVKQIEKITTLLRLRDGQILAAGLKIRDPQVLLFLDEAGEVNKVVRLPYVGITHQIIELEEDLLLAGTYESLAGDVFGVIQIKRSGELVWGWDVRGRELGRINAWDNTVREIIPHAGGYYLGASSGHEAIAASLDRNGKEIWRTYVDTLYSDGKGVLLHSSGDIWVTGQGQVSRNDRIGGGGIMVACVSPQGKLRWKKNYGSSHASYGHRILEGKKGEVYVLADDKDDSLLMRLDRAGRRIVQKAFYPRISRFVGFLRLKSGELVWFQQNGDLQPENTCYRFELAEVAR